MTATSWVSRWAPIGAPAIAAISLVLAWGTQPGVVLAIVLAIILIGAILAAVHHAEVIAHRVGEPFGALILAVAVTVIEVGLIVTLSAGGGEESAALARDTVFSAYMITTTGIVGLAIWIGGNKFGTVRFNPQGSGAALATVSTLAVLCLVLPNFTEESGPRFSPSQLAFAAIASLALYGMFVVTQTISHRKIFLPVTDTGSSVHHDDDEDTEDAPSETPSVQEALLSLALLVISLVCVVGLAKLESPSIEGGVAVLKLPESFVGVIIALVILLPEGIAASRAARRNHLQTSLNLGFGSAMASIGLTIPAIAVASIWLPGQLVLGLGNTQIVLLLLSIVVSILTVVPGRARTLQGGVHLVLFAAFLFLSISP